MYRYQGVNPKRAAKVSVDGCCEPVCGPTNCGSSAKEIKEPEKFAFAAANAAGGCCEPDCGPTTCG